MTIISMETSALDIVSILHMGIVQGLDIYIVKTVSGLVFLLRTSFFYSLYIYLSYEGRMK